MASAFAGQTTSGYHYQYSVPFAAHQADLTAIFGPAAPSQSAEFVLAFRHIWGNFIIRSDPSISNTEANGASAGNPTATNAASKFPVWVENAPQQLNLNVTGGIPYTATTNWGTEVIQEMAPGQSNAITEVDAYAWEAGRGKRCELWKSLADKIMK
jgi:hypothetical protein